MKTNKLISSLLVSTLVLTLAGAGVVSAAESATELNGTGTIEFEKSKEVTKPIDPENPGEEVEEEEGEDKIVVNPNEGEDLNLDLISNFDFGTFTDYKVSATDTLRQPAAPVNLKGGLVRGNWVQVTDQRAGLPTGWKLTAKMEADFTNATGATLPGAYISLESQNTNSNFPLTTAAANSQAVDLKAGVEAAVINVPGEKGNGTTTVEFGKSEDDSMSNAVNLNILPGTGVEDTSTYTATIVWTLSEV